MTVTRWRVVIRADAGSLLVGGREVAIRNPHADRLGLGMVYQHFTLVPSMTAAENLVMARSDVPRIVDWRRERERQKAEILKQLYLERRLLVLDEPTSTLTPQEAEEVLGFIRDLARGATSRW